MTSDFIGHTKAALSDLGLHIELLTEAIFLCDQRDLELFRLCVQAELEGTSARANLGQIIPVLLLTTLIFTAVCVLKEPPRRGKLP